MKRLKLAFAVVAFSGLFLFALLNTTHGALLNQIIDHYALQSSSQGLLVAAQNAGGMIALALSFLLTRRLGKVKYLMLAMAAAGLFILPVGFAPSFGVLVCLYGVIGLALGSIDTLTSAVIADLYEGAARTRMMCILHATFGFGGIVTPKLIELAMGAGARWNEVFFGIGAIGLLIALAALPVGRKVRARGLCVSATGGISMKAVRAFLFDRDRALLTLVVTLNAFSFNNVQVWVDRYVDVSLGQPASATLALSMFWLGMTASRAAMSFVKIKPVTYLRFGMLLSGAFLLIGICSGSAPVVCATTLLGALSAGAAMPMTLTEICTRYKGDSIVATTIALFCIYLAQLISPIFVGALTAAVGLSHALTPAVIATALGGMAALGVRK